MPYYLLYGLKAFYWEAGTAPGRFSELTDRDYYSSLNAHEHFRVHIKDDWHTRKPTKEWLGRETKRLEYLHGDYVNNGKDWFIDNWVNFSFQGDDAPSAACVVLDDYMKLTGKGFLSNVPGYWAETKAHYQQDKWEARDENLYIKLELLPPPRTRWWHKQERATQFCLHLNLLDVVSVKGSLDSFVIETSSREYHFDESIFFKDKYKEAG